MLVCNSSALATTAARKLTMYEALRRVYSGQREVWHERRADLFVDLMRPARGARVLDLGGGRGEFTSRLRRRLELSITIADIATDALEDAKRLGFETTLLTEDGPLPFSDGTFDIVFCNSVIEHVTLPKEECLSDIPEAQWQRRSIERQTAFAREIMRVGKSFFVQTPHRSFPVESHTWLPFVGWLSHRATARVVRVADKIWVKQCEYADWNLLDEEQLLALFPGSSVHVERTLGFPKSMIAYGTSTPMTAQ